MSLQKEITLLILPFIKHEKYDDQLFLDILKMCPVTILEFSEINRKPTRKLLYGLLSINIKYYKYYNRTFFNLSYYEEILEKYLNDTFKKKYNNIDIKIIFL